jgi:hypothetical protein
VTTGGAVRGGEEGLAVAPFIILHVSIG